MNAARALPLAAPPDVAVLRCIYLDPIEAAAYAAGGRGREVLLDALTARLRARLREPGSAPYAQALLPGGLVVLVVPEPRAEVGGGASR